MFDKRMFDDKEELAKLKAMATQIEEKARNNQPTVSEIRSNAKKCSDDKIFKVRREVVHAQLSEQKSDVPKPTIGGEEGKAFTQYLIDKIEETFTEEKDQHIRKGLLDELNKSVGMGYSAVWWMIVVCMLPGDRDKYNTPKENEGKVKDPKRVVPQRSKESEISLKRELTKWKNGLDYWIPTNLLTMQDGMIDEKEEELFLEEAKCFLDEHADMLVKKIGSNAKKKLLYVLEKSTGRSYGEKCWMTIASFRIMKGSKGSYKKRRKADNGQAFNM